MEKHPVLDLFRHHPASGITGEAQANANRLGEMTARLIHVGVTRQTRKGHKATPMEPAPY
jgi:hypothetical protein